MENESYEKFKKHLRLLEKNKEAYTYYLDNKECRDKLIKNFNKYLKDDYPNRYLTERRKKILCQMITLLFETQNKKPFFYFENESFPLCWNRPGKHFCNWELDYIKYEWGHLYPEGVDSNNNKVDIFENLSLQSGHCNDKIQNIMNVDQVRCYGGQLKERIDYVMKKRKELFDLPKWKKLKEEFIK